MTNKTTNGPRISVQFEIDGTEDNETLAEMKKVEAVWEKAFADIFKKHVELAINEEREEKVKEEKVKNGDIILPSDCPSCKHKDLDINCDYPCRDCHILENKYEKE